MKGKRLHTFLLGRALRETSIISKESGDVLPFLRAGILVDRRLDGLETRSFGSVALQLLDSANQKGHETLLEFLISFALLLIGIITTTR